MERAIKIIFLALQDREQNLTVYLRCCDGYIQPEPGCCFDVPVKRPTKRSNTFCKRAIILTLLSFVSIIQLFTDRTKVYFITTYLLVLSKQFEYKYHFSIH